MDRGDATPLTAPAGGRGAGQRRFAALFFAAPFFAAGFAAFFAGFAALLFTGFALFAGLALFAGADFEPEAFFAGALAGALAADGFA